MISFTSVRSGLRWLVERLLPISLVLSLLLVVWIFVGNIPGKSVEVRAGVKGAYFQTASEEIGKFLKKDGININGPFPADTLFLKNNRSRYDVIIGMYHDQVLTPIKTLCEFDAINITLGLPFMRISPDHGPNEKMIGKNLSDPTSLIRALQILDN